MKNIHVKKLLSLLTAGVMIGTASQSNAALTFTTLNLNGNSTLSDSGDISGFPLGNNTLLGKVPFLQNNTSGQVWNAEYAGGGSKAISVNIPNATGFYSLINTWWGKDASQGSFASISFDFADNSSFTKDLYGNADIRDFSYTSGWTTQINGTTTRNVYLNPGVYAIDRQWIDFGAHTGKTLTGVTFTDNGGTQFQRLLLSGATVQSGETGQLIGRALLPGETANVPEPGQVAASMLLLAGLGVFFIIRRRKAAIAA